MAKNLSARSPGEETGYPLGILACNIQLHSEVLGVGLQNIHFEGIKFNLQHR